MDQERDWAQQWAVTTGRCVRRWRTTRKLSAQKLADLCAVLGMPGLTRTVITKLENGRKESVSTAELMVLAKALDVPPVMLMFPLGEQPAVEITPGEFVGVVEAMYSMAGLDPRWPVRAAEHGSALDLFLSNDNMVKILLRQRRDLPAVVREVTLGDLEGKLGTPALPHEEELIEMFQRNATVLKTTRDALRRMGFEPPPLPPELAQVEDVGEDLEDPDGSR